MLAAMMILLVAAAAVYSVDLPLRHDALQRQADFVFCVLSFAGFCSQSDFDRVGTEL
jgi:hypothetical protein